MAHHDKQRQRDMLRQWDQQRRSAARAAPALPAEQLLALFDALDCELPARGCDHSPRLKRCFLERSGLSVDEVFTWLD